MTDFTNQIRAMIKEVIIKELGVKNEEIKSNVSQIVEKKVNEQLVTYITEEAIEALVAKHLENHLRGILASKFRYHLNAEIDAAIKKLSGDVKISFTS